MKSSGMRDDAHWDRRKLTITHLRSDGWSVARLAARYMTTYQDMAKRLEKWGIGVKTKTAEVLEPRNDEIIRLVHEGLSDKEIAARMKGRYPEMTRGVVLGLRNRRGLLKDPASRNRAQRVNSSKNGMGGNLRAKLGTAPKPPLLEAPAPARLPEKTAGRWVSFEQMTGCRWCEGDPREGTAVFCNAPRCDVKLLGGDVERVNYCCEHWERRRSSRYTRVITARRV